MSRNLTLADYGILISLVSVITLLAVPASAITPTIVNVAGGYFADDNFPMLHAFYKKTLKVIFVGGFILSVLLIGLSPFLGSFLKIDNPIFFPVAAFAVLLSYFLTINNSFLQARLSFRATSINNAFSTFIKVIVGFVSIIVGWGLGGAVVGILLSFIVALLISAYLLKGIVFFRSEIQEHVSLRKLVGYGIPSAVIVFCLTAFISIDILLVKHLFPEQIAGQYAGLSLVGRVIFFITAPISSVMFPIIINRHNKKQKYKHILLTALGLVGVLSAAVTVFYFLFPEFTILFFLKNKEYLTTVPYVGLFGVFITMYSLLNVLSYYYLSIQETRVSYFLLAGVVLQGLLIYFTPHSIPNIIASSLIVVSILLFIFLINLGFKKSIFR